MSERLNSYSVENPLPMPDPRTIVSETAVLLPMYFAETLEDNSPALDYFSDYTANFLTNVNRGFMLTQAISLTNASNKDLERLLFRQGDLVTDDPDMISPKTRAIESFNLTLTIFSQMPDLADHRKYSPVYYNKLAVTPPQNSFEFLERIEELRGFIDGITNHTINPKHVRRLTVEDKVYRSMAFFQVGKDMPIKQAPRRNEILQLLDRFWN
jgi:hypothetical protein